MPYAARSRCKHWRPGETWHRGKLSIRGCCARCVQKLKSAGGRRGTGLCKVRRGAANGRYLRKVNNYLTWNSLALEYDDFEYLLVAMHKNRRDLRPGPYLLLGDLPVRMLDKYDNKTLLEVIDIMTTTKFCNLNRYQDYVSEELTRVMKCRKLDIEHKIFVSIMVRFKQSPRGLATALLKDFLQDPSMNSKNVIKTAKQFKRSVCYRQTGITNTRLYAGITASVCRVAAAPSHVNWEELETVITRATKTECRGSKQEHFSSRQVAADLCKIPGFVGGLAADSLPVDSVPGPGAKCGYHHAERAKGVSTSRIVLPRRLPYLRQSGMCEYHKLVARWNFPHLRKRALYKPKLWTENMVYVRIHLYTVVAVGVGCRRAANIHKICQQTLVPGYGCFAY